jgi:MFS transporter, DHA1 family, multidrug resistance protein
MFIFLLPETSTQNILFRRAHRLRKITGNDKLISEPELLGEEMTGKDVVMMVLVRPFTLLFTEPIVLLLDLYIALIYGVLYIWFESFPIVFVEIYGFPLDTEGLAFLGILVGVAVVLPPFFWHHHKYTVPKFNENGEITPEWRLPPSFVGAFAIPICLFWFGWTSREDIHWIVPIIGTAWFTIGAFLLFNPVLNYLGDAYPEYIASVLAGNDLVRSAFGAGFVSFPLLQSRPGYDADDVIAALHKSDVQQARRQLGQLDVGVHLDCVYTHSLRALQIRQGDQTEESQSKTRSLEMIVIGFA